MRRFSALISRWTMGGCRLCRYLGEGREEGRKDGRKEGDIKTRKKNISKKGAKEGRAEGEWPADVAVALVMVDEVAVLAAAAA